MKLSAKFIPITDNEILELQRTHQIFADCYLTSSLNSFCRTEKGRQLLKQNIHKSAENDGGFKIHFPDIKSQPEDVFVTQKEINNLKLTDLLMNPIEHGFKENNIQKAVEIAMDKLINKYPSLKSFICLYANCVENFEYNFPSLFMKIFTGKQPIVLNEKTLHMTLKSKKDKVLELFKKLDKTNGDFNFVAGTGAKFKSGFDDWHCYTVESVNARANTINLHNTRTCNTITMDFDTFIKKFKYLTGYISKDFTQK